MSGDITVPARGHSHQSAKAKPQSGSAKKKNGPVSYLVVNASVWEMALKIAEKKVERIEVISPVKVEIWTVGGKVTLCLVFGPQESNMTLWREQKHLMRNSIRGSKRNRQYHGSN